MNKTVKKVSSYALTFIAGTLFSGGAVFAATTYVQAQKNSSVIAFNGKQVSAPPSLVYDGSTYIQLYSIQQGFKQFYGVKPSWDGHTFNVVTNQPSQPTSSNQGIVFSNITVKGDGAGDTIVDGLAKNTTSTTHTFTILVTFYDASGKILGTADGAVQDLAPGGTKTFEAAALSDYTNAAKYTVQVDAID